MILSYAHDHCKCMITFTIYLTVILRNCKEYCLILSQQGCTDCRLSWLNSAIFCKIEQDNCFIILQIANKTYMYCKLDKLWLCSILQKVGQILAIYKIMAAAALGELTGLFPINQLKLTGLKKGLMRPRISRVNRLLTRLAVPMEINQRTIDFLTGLG